MALAVDANDDFELNYQHEFELTWNIIIKVRVCYQEKNKFSLSMLTS